MKLNDAWKAKMWDRLKRIRDRRKESPPPPQYDYDKLMKQLKSYEEIVEEEPFEGQPPLCWSGLLRNHPNAADRFYDRSHGELHIRVQPAVSDKKVAGFTANLFIHSIADGSVVLLGPVEPLEKAERRALMLKAETEEWGGWIPTAEQVIEAARKIGCYWNR